MRSQPRAKHCCIQLAICAVALATVVSACASRKPVTPVAPAPPPSTRDIEALIEQGCFTCLERALVLADERGARHLAFESSSLLALRAVELGMPGDTWLARARALAADDATRAQYIEIVEAVPPDPLRGLRDDLLVETQVRNRIQARLASVASWYEVLQSGPHSNVFRSYLEMTLLCSVDRRTERTERLDAIVSTLPDVPLLKYRAGLCDDRHQGLLLAVQSQVPAFVDADYALGRYALRDPEKPDQDAAMRRFKSAAAAFPSSTAIPTTIGNLYQTWEDWPNALTAFDDAIRLLPSHPDALLGRVISLSNLERHEEAIATATQMIDTGRWHLGQAFYWRAWNYFNVGNTQAARSDADRTRTLMVNPAVFLLSGLIEWRLVRRETAETEFQEALKMDFGQCEAAFYLGGVRFERAKLPEALAAMNQARQCYDLTLAVRQKLLDQVLAGPGTPESKARDAAKHRRSIANVQKRRDEALAAIDRVQNAQRPAEVVAPTVRPSPRGR